jgi:hypothetical protein
MGDRFASCACCLTSATTFARSRAVAALRARGPARFVLAAADFFAAEGCAERPSLEAPLRLLALGAARFAGARFAGARFAGVLAFSPAF